MPNPVVIDFIIKGMPEVQAALRTTERATAAAERASAAVAKRGADARVREAEREAKMKIAAMRKIDAFHMRAQDKALRDVQRAAKAQERAEEQAVKASIRAAERRSREVQRIKEREFRELQRSLQRQEAEENRKAAQWVKREERKRFIQERDEIRNRRAFATSIGGAVGSGAMRGAQRVAGAAVGTMNMVGQLGGGFGIADSVQRSVALKGKLADMASRDQDPTDPTKKDRKSTAMLEGQVRGVASEFGIEADRGADALDKFASKTGNLDKGMQMLRGLAELSRAGAGELDNLADAAGDIFNADKSQSAEQVLQKLRVFAIQGQKGAVEMKDLASQMAKVAAASGRFKDGGQESILTFGALAQLARESGGAASSREATTAVSSLANQFNKNARLGKMSELGADVKGEDGFNRPIEDILMDILKGAEAKSRAKGHGLKDFDMYMGTAIADAQARKATNPLEKAFKAAGGGEAGLAAARAELAKFGADKNRDLKKEFGDKAQARMGEDDVKIARIREDFDKMVSTKLLPALMRLVPEFEKLVPLFVDLNAQALPAFVDLIKTIGEYASKHKELIHDIAAHPIGAILAAEVTRSVGGALIGEGVKTIIQKAFGDAALGPVFGKVLSSQLGQAGLIVGAAAIAIQQGMVAIDQEYKKGDELRQKGWQDATEAAGIAGRMRNGTATDEDRAKASKLVSQLGTDAEQIANDHNNPGFWKKAGRGVGSVFAPEATAQAAADEKAQTEKQIGELVKVMRELQTAVRDNTGATRAGAGGGAGGAPGAARSKPMTERN